MKAQLTVAAFAALAFASVAPAVEIDGFAARVGTMTILRSEVLAEMQRLGERDESHYNQVRNDLIDRKLILKAASEAKMTIQEWVIENRVREIVAKVFGGDRNKLIEMLGKQKVSYPEWYAHTKEDMIINAMRWNVVEKNISPSPSAMRQEYEAHPEKYAKGHRVSVSVILLKPEEASRRDEISAALKEKGFDELGGRKYENIDPVEVFKPEIVKEIEKMPKGTISHWIEIDGWSFLLRKDAETAGKRQTFEEAYEAVEAAVKAAEAKRLYKAWVERLRAENYVRVF